MWSYRKFWPSELTWEHMLIHAHRWLRVIFSCWIKYFMYKLHIIYKLQLLLCWSCSLLMFWKSQITFSWSCSDWMPNGQEAVGNEVCATAACWQCILWQACCVRNCSSGFTVQIFYPSKLQIFALKLLKMKPWKFHFVLYLHRVWQRNSAPQWLFLPRWNELLRNTSSFTSLWGVDLFGLVLVFFKCRNISSFFEWTAVAFCGSWFALQLGSLTAFWHSLCASSGDGVSCVSFV